MRKSLPDDSKIMILHINVVDLKIVTRVKDPMQAKSSPTREGFHLRHWLLCSLTIGLIECLTAAATIASPGTRISISFPGPEETVPGDIVPDTNGAVGYEFIMAPLNHQVLIQTKTGQDAAVPQDLQDFWDGLISGVPADPVIVFDPYTNRWFFTAMERGGAHLLLAISQTSDPRDPWYKWSVPAPGIDQPKIGFNGKWIAVQADAVRNVINTSYSAIFLFDKAPLLAGAPPRLEVQQDQPAPNYKVFSRPSLEGLYMSPARTYDAHLADLYVLQSSKTPDPTTINALHIFKFSGVSAVTASFDWVGEASSLGENWTSRFNRNLQEPGVHGAPQVGDPNQISADDDRIHNCIYRNGALWTAQTIYLPAGPSPTVSAIQWWQISVSPLDAVSVVQRKVIGGPGLLGIGEIVEVKDENEFREKEAETPGNVLFRTHPSLAVNANEDVLIGYSTFSLASPPSAACSFRFGTDILGSTQPEAGIASGEAKYVRNDDHPLYRWGDYSAAVVDPINDRDMWTIQTRSGSPEPAPTLPPEQPTPTPNTFWKTDWAGIYKTFARFAAGLQHSVGQRRFAPLLFLSASGTNLRGQLGNGGGPPSNGPVGVALENKRIIDVAAGYYNNLAVDISGTVYAWGGNDYGQLGNGTLSPLYANTPTIVGGVSQPLHLFTNSQYFPVSTYFGNSPSIVASNLGNCAAVDSLGQVWTWGANWDGQLGDGTTTPRYSPGLVKKDASNDSLKDVVSIAVGSAHMVALKSDGTVWAWGWGYRGTLGDGDLTDHSSPYPQQVRISATQFLTNVAHVVCGNNFALALTRDGRVYGWGQNAACQLGLGVDTCYNPNNPNPEHIDHKGYATFIIEPIDRIAAGAYHSLAHSPSDGRVYAWGNNGYGQCGFGVFNGNQPYPLPMAEPNSGFKDIAAGPYCSFLTRGIEETVYAAGDNAFGQLATGDYQQKNIPTQTQYHPAP